MCIYVYVVGAILICTIIIYLVSKHSSDSRPREKATQAKPSGNKSDSIGRQDKSLRKSNAHSLSQTSDIEEPTPGRSTESMISPGFDDFALLGMDLSDNAEEKCSPIPLLKERGGELRLDKNALRNLLNPDVLKNMPIAVISIAGAYRMGKSFLLNLLLRYFEKQGWNDKTNGEWLRDWNSSKQNGIAWCGGSEGHTRGIVAWGKPIIVQKTDGNEIAVILLDTQGNFEHARRKEENVGIFALSTLFSSLQIFNVSKQIQANDLEYLQCFAEFSKIAKPKTESNVDSGYRESQERCFFQDLVFLVRDWHSPKSFQYGHIGGNKYLSKILVCSDEENEAGVHRYLRNAFTMLGCFLMPEPDSKVRITEDDAQLLRSSDLGDKFLNGVVEFAFKYFHPDTIPTKSIGFLQNVTAKDLVEYMEQCAEGALNGNLPNFPTMMQGVTEYANVRVIEKAELNFKESFQKELEEMKEPTWEAFDDAFLKEKKRAVELFLQSTHYGSDVNRDQQKNRLMGHLENTKATMIEEMNRLRVRYSRAVVDAWLKESIQKLQNHRKYFYTKVGELKDIETDCLKTSFRKNSRDCSQVTNTLQEGKEKLEAAYNDNVRDAEIRNSKAKHVAIVALMVGGAVSGSVVAAGYLLGEVMIGAGLASVTGVASWGGWMKRGLDAIWSEHQEKQKTE